MISNTAGWTFSLTPTSVCPLGCYSTVFSSSSVYYYTQHLPTELRIGSVESPIANQSRYLEISHYQGQVNLLTRVVLWNPPHPPIAAVVLKRGDHDLQPAADLSSPSSFPHFRISYDLIPSVFSHIPIQSLYLGYTSW